MAVVSTVMTLLPLMWQCKENIVQVLSVAAVPDSLPLPMEKFGSRHIANIAGTRRVATNKRLFYKR